MLRNFLYLLYFCLCLDLGLFMSYLCGPLLIFIFIFIPINCMDTDTLVLFFRICPRYLDDNVDKECEKFKQEKFSLRVLLSICLILCHFQPGLAYKSVTYKKKKCISFTMTKQLLSGSCFTSASAKRLPGIISVIISSSSSSIGSTNFATGSICGDNVRAKQRVVKYKFLLPLRSHIQHRFSSD